MSAIYSSPKPSSDQEPRTFLVGAIDSLPGLIKCCPTASSLVCRELETGLDAIIAIPCKRWGCKWCGQRRAFRLALQCETAKPNKLLTLTINPKRWITPRDAYDGTRRKVSDLVKLIRKEKGECEFLRVLEVTKKGWPHYHLVTRCPFIAQDWLSTEWCKLTDAPIVDIRAVKEGGNVFKYVMKYLCKQVYVPWTNRRVSWSRGFFPKPEDQGIRQNPFVNRGRNPKHPIQLISSLHTRDLCIERRPGVWVFVNPSEAQSDPRLSRLYERRIPCAPTNE